MSDILFCTAICTLLPQFFIPAALSNRMRKGRAATAYRLIRKGCIRLLNTVGGTQYIVDSTNIYIYIYIYIVLFTSSHSCSPPAMLDLKKRLSIFFSQRPNIFGRCEKKGGALPFPEKRKNEIGYCVSARYSRVTIWPRVQSALGLNLPFPVPLVMPFSFAQATAFA